MNHLLSKEGQLVSKDRVWQEYPRPDFVRQSYLNLNGEWDFAIQKSKEIPSSFELKILVPFAVESLLSGINHGIEDDDYLVYQRHFVVEQKFIRDITLLHFEAVDYETSVYLNGIHLGDHVGGYIPFSFDVSKVIKKGDNLLQVIVKDDTDNRQTSKGKQSKNRGGMWYTPTSGIWQTVWMESVEAGHVKSAKFTPNIDDKTLTIELDVDQNKYPVETHISTKDNKTTIISIKEPVTVVPFEEIDLWSPEEPNLYTVTFYAGLDQVISYFGFRKISVGQGPFGPVMYLNNQPYFHNGLLDQGYFSDGIMTPPSDKALKNDIIKMKELGFNTLRKHIKFELRRFYFYCDFYGMLVWQDMMSGGAFDKLRMQYMPFIGLDKMKDHTEKGYKIAGRTDSYSREQYEQELTEMIGLLYNHPSIVIWVPFNEGWGQFDSLRITEKIRQLDPTRLIDHASGWFDQGGGDLRSVHIYLKKLKMKVDRHRRPFVLSEFGGYSYQVPDHLFNESNEYGYSKYKSMKEFEDALIALYEEQVIPLLKQGLAGTIYTQVSDVEDETNGLLTYDRKVIKVRPERIKKVMSKLKI